MRTRSERGADGGYGSGFQALMNLVDGLLPRDEIIERSIRQERAIYPIEAIREVAANALIHQDLTVTGAGPMIELFEDRVEVTSPGKPLIDTDRFIDLPPRSRNENMASIMRRMYICEERGSGIDKVITYVELFKLPPPEFRVEGDNTKAVLYGPRGFRDMDQNERIRACYQHAALRHQSKQRATNASLRERFGIAEHNAAMVSRIVNDAIAAGLIKASNPWNARTGHYLPYWA